MTDRLAASQVALVAASIGSRLMPDNDQWVNRFTVASRSSDKEYTVAQRRGDSSWGCSCWAWRTKRACPHLRDILRRLAAVPAATYEAPVQSMLAHAKQSLLDLDVTPVKVPRRKDQTLLDF